MVASGSVETVSGGGSSSPGRCRARCRTSGATAVVAVELSADSSSDPHAARPSASDAATRTDAPARGPRRRDEMLDAMDTVWRKVTLTFRHVEALAVARLVRRVAGLVAGSGTTVHRLRRALEFNHDPALEAPVRRVAGHLRPCTGFLGANRPRGDPGAFRSGSPGRSRREAEVERFAPRNRCRRRLADHRHSRRGGVARAGRTADAQPRPAARIRSVSSSPPRAARVEASGSGPVAPSSRSSPSAVGRAEVAAGGRHGGEVGHIRIDGALEEEDPLVAGLRRAEAVDDDRPTVRRRGLLLEHDPRTRILTRQHRADLQRDDLRPDPGPVRGREDPTRAHGQRTARSRRRRSPRSSPRATRRSDPTTTTSIGRWSDGRRGARTVEARARSHP